MKKWYWLVAVVAAGVATGAGAQGSASGRTATERWANARMSDMRLGLESQIAARPTYEDAEIIAAEAAAGINPGRASRLVYVDGAATNTAETGSAAAPYLTVQAAFDHIGNAENAEAYADADQRYWQVTVAPGRYVGDVTVPWRPYVGITLDSAVIAGDVIRAIPAWPGTSSNRTSTLVIRGNSMRAAYLDGVHSVVGVEGAVRFQGAASSGLYASLIHELHVNQAGISDGVRFEGGSNNQMGHVFLRDAQAGAVVSTNRWHGVSLFAYGWSGGHTGGGPAGSGIGPLLGTVVPYNIYDMLISKGMTLTAPYSGWSGACRWHNVVFEAGDYTVTNIGYSVNLDMASYTAWMAATGEAGRGGWRLGASGRMTLTDAPEPQVTGTNAPTLVLPRWTGDELVVTGADAAILAVVKAAKYGSLMGVGVIFGASAWVRFKNAEKVRGRFVVGRTVGGRGEGVVCPTEATATNLFVGSPEVRTSYMVYDDSAPGLADNVKFLLDDTVLIFARRPNPTRRDPSFMKTFRLMGKYMVPSSYLRDDGRVEVAKFDWSEDIRVTNGAAVVRLNVSAT